MFCDAFSPHFCSDWSLGSTEDGHLGIKFPGSITPQRSLARLLRNSARERQNREYCINKEASLFQASNISRAMSNSKCSQVSPLLFIATWKNGKCASSWLGKECKPVIIRDLSQMSTESVLCIFSASVSSPDQVRFLYMFQQLRWSARSLTGSGNKKAGKNVKLRITNSENSCRSSPSYLPVSRQYVCWLGFDLVHVHVSSYLSRALN